MSLIDMVNEMEDKLFLISKNIERDLNTVVIKGKINKNETMKTILIKGKQGSGKTTLATRLSLNGDSIHISQDGFKLYMLVKYKHIVIDECLNYEEIKEQLKYVNRIKGGSLICVTQNEEFSEKGFDLVFRLY